MIHLQNTKLESLKICFNENYPYLKDTQGMKWDTVVSGSLGVRELMWGPESIEFPSRGAGLTGHIQHARRGVSTKFTRNQELGWRGACSLPENAEEDWNARTLHHLQKGWIGCTHNWATALRMVALEKTVKGDPLSTSGRGRVSSIGSSNYSQCTAGVCRDSPKIVKKTKHITKNKIE